MDISAREETKRGEYFHSALACPAKAGMRNPYYDNSFSPARE